MSDTEHEPGDDLGTLEPPTRERMTATEAIMWAVEKDPALRSDFCNLTILDHVPDPERVRATLRRALDVIPRLRQRVIGAPLRLVPPEFADDPTLDLEAHVRTVAVPSPGDDRALLDVVGALAEQPLDRAKPLWEFTLIEGLSGGRAALLQKLHHTITDGVGGLRLSLALVDLEPNPDDDEDDDLFDDDEYDEFVDDDEEDNRHTPIAVTRDAIIDAARNNAALATNLARTATHVLTHPQELPDRARTTARVARSLRRQLLIADGAHSDVMKNRSQRRYLATHTRSLETIRVVSSKLGGSINDGFVTAVASALGRYHERFHSDVSELRLAMAISTRGKGDYAANRFVPARVVVPIQPAHDLPALFDLVRNQLETAKTEPSLGIADTFAGFVAGLPTSLLVAFTRSQTRTIDFGASNMRGSPVPLYLAGARILANLPFGPRTGTALNITTMSYCDELHLGLNIDPAAITDPPAFLRDLSDAFDALIASI
ncbi:MAG TPA: wax ester/triacylglycerol synthase domain-containing protein [Acidimicrobiia bacterium]|nr:wax ester/triacylglycerol synthase domain-containing protein [Acidimicrobiia bacterium]